MNGARAGGRARGGRWRAAGCASAIVVAGLARDANATPSAKLTYVRGPGAERCPDETELKKAVAARLGYDVFFPWAKTTVVAEIARAPKGFSGKVQVVDEHANVRGQRAIASASEDCADVVRALALAISIAVDDFGIDDATAPPSPPNPPSPPSPEPTETRDDARRGGAPAEPVTPPPARRSGRVEARGAPSPPPPVGFGLWVAPIVSFGIAPTAAVGLHVDVELRYRSLTFGLEGRGDLPATASETPGGRVTTHLLGGSFVPCVHTAVRLFLCGVVTAGDFHEAGSDLATSRSADAAFSAIGARAGVEIPLTGRLVFIGHADALATLTRHAVQIDGDTVFTIAPVTGTLGLGLGARF